MVVGDSIKLELEQDYDSDSELIDLPIQGYLTAKLTSLELWINQPGLPVFTWTKTSRRPRTFEGGAKARGSGSAVPAAQHRRDAHARRAITAKLLHLSPFMLISLASWRLIVASSFGH